MSRMSQTAAGLQGFEQACKLCQELVLDFVAGRGFFWLDVEGIGVNRGGKRLAKWQGFFTIAYALEAILQLSSARHNNHSSI